MRSALSMVGAVAALAVSCASCNDPVEPAWRLDRPRVLGARVAPVADPARASVRPGEEIAVELFTASRERPRGAYARFALGACAANPNGAVTACRGPALADLSGAGANDPTLTLRAPAEPGELLVFGVVCTTGAPVLSPLAAGKEVRGACDGGAGQEVAIRVAVGGPDDRQPALGEGAILLDGKPLSADAPCEAGGPGIRADGGSHDLVFIGRALGREPGESVIVSHLATHGDLDRLYTAPDGDADGKVVWKAPSSIGQPRETARFHFSVRDGRGGAAFLTRTICIERGAST